MDKKSIRGWDKKYPQIAVINKQSFGINGLSHCHSAICTYSGSLGSKEAPILELTASLTGIPEDKIEVGFRNSTIYAPCTQALGRCAMRLRKETDDRVDLYILDPALIKYLLKYVLPGIPNENLHKEPVLGDTAIIRKKGKPYSKSQSSIDKLARIKWIEGMVELNPDIKGTEAATKLLEDHGINVSRQVAANYIKKVKGL